MNPARKATPDSEAVVSSEDERPWPSSTSFGKFPMKENSVPGLPGGIWSNQKRGSFKMSEAAQRNAAREARLGAVNPSHAALRAGATPSPSASEGANSLPFAIPLQPTPKTGRSLSHSQGQREVLQSAGQQQQNTQNLPLGLLPEEVDTESESDVGSRLTHTTSHPPIGSLMRPATLPAAYDYHGNGREPEDLSPTAQPGLLRGRTFESAFANLNIDQAPRRAQWQSHLGWDDVLHVNESRRHSLADIPTRRGSLAAGEPSHLSRVFTQDAIEDEPAHYQGFAMDRAIDTPSDRRLSRAQETSSGNIIPPMYRVPHVELNQHERNEIEARREQANMQQTPWGAGGARPRKQLYLVGFKCSRVDVFYLLDNTGLVVNVGDMVIVEADRGQDLGTVQHANVTQDAARVLKKKYSEEQYKWLMMYSRNKDGGHNPNAQLHGESGASGQQLFPDAPATMQGSIPRDNFSNLKPKAIKRLASDFEVKMLAEKEGNEAKAKRTCQQKVAHLRLQMEILDAEWQWDFQKLIFYYYADHYINFKDLITELYRIYKTRIWLSAINPASFSQHAMGQPPSGIGPGAVPPFNPYAINNAYTMSYGEDRDPYGAHMPYEIHYDTYTPNYPAIPGVTNSFAPGGLPNGQNYMFYGGNSVDPSATMPPTQPVEHVTSTVEQNPVPPELNADINFGGTDLSFLKFSDTARSNELQPFVPVRNSSTSIGPSGLGLPPAGMNDMFGGRGNGSFRPANDQFNGPHPSGPTGRGSGLSRSSGLGRGSGLSRGGSGLGRGSGLPAPIARPTPMSASWGDPLSYFNRPQAHEGNASSINRPPGSGGNAGNFVNANTNSVEYQSNQAQARQALNKHLANYPSSGDMRSKDMSRKP